MSNADEHVTEEQLQTEAWGWVFLMTSGDARRADLQAMRRWRALSPRHAAALAKAGARWRALGPALESVAGRPQGAALRAVGTRPIGRRAVLGGALAASAAGAVSLMYSPPFGLWSSAQELFADYRTEAGEQRRFSPAEHVSIEMNTRTSLNARKSPAGTDRIELVSGEALVETKGKPVELIAATGRTHTSSARFNVHNNGSIVAVTCLSGSVEIDCGGDSVALNTGEQVSYTRGSGLDRPAVVDTASLTAWRHGDLFFDNDLLSHAIEEINRYRSGKIILANASLGQRRLTAHFKLDRLDVVFAQLEIVFGARLTSLPGGFVIVS